MYIQCVDKGNDNDIWDYNRHDKHVATSKTKIFGYSGTKYYWFTKILVYYSYLKIDLRKFKLSASRKRLCYAVEFFLAVKCKFLHMLHNYFYDKAIECQV